MSDYKDSVDALQKALMRIMNEDTERYNYILNDLLSVVDGNKNKLIDIIP